MEATAATISDRTGLLNFGSALCLCRVPAVLDFAVWVRFVFFMLNKKTAGEGANLVPPRHDPLAVSPAVLFLVLRFSPLWFVAKGEFEATRRSRGRRWQIDSFDLPRQSKTRLTARAVEKPTPPPMPGSRPAPAALHYAPTAHSAEQGGGIFARGL